jgi:hypothetical protein
MFINLQLELFNCVLKTESPLFVTSLANFGDCVGFTLIPSWVVKELFTIIIPVPVFGGRIKLPILVTPSVMIIVSPGFDIFKVFCKDSFIPTIIVIPFCVGGVVFIKVLGGSSLVISAETFVYATKKIITITIYNIAIERTSLLILVFIYNPSIFFIP